MTSSPTWIICEHCDSVYESVPLTKGQTARCVRCAAILGRGGQLSLQQLLALSISAALLFVFANAFPVISISLQGLSNQATLWQSVQALAQGQLSPMAAVAGLAIILAPFLQKTSGHESSLEQQTLGTIRPDHCAGPCLSAMLSSPTAGCGKPHVRW